LSIFRKAVEKIKISWKSDKNNGYFTWRPVYIFYYITLSSSKDKKYLDRSCRGSFLFSNFVFWKFCCLWDNVEKYCRSEQATDNSMAHGHSMLDN
jgi:hypothetical protein